AVMCELQWPPVSHVIYSTVMLGRPSQGQCTPMPLPALGTQRIIQGNGTNVGTVISLQCPAKHTLVGGDLVCVMGTNSTQWVGETYCKPLSPYEDFGFRVAVLASIVSSAIILLMSMAFITCCLVDCIKEEKRKKQEREIDLWHREERIERRVDNRSHYSHKGRNNNNNTQEQKPKFLSLWDNHDPAVWDNKKARRCRQHYAYGPAVPPLASTFGPAPPLPGRDCDLPLLPQNSESEQNSDPPKYVGPSWSSCPSKSSGLVHISAAGSSNGVVWQYGGQESSFSLVNQPATDESYRRNTNTANELSIQIISV
uniref:Sushi domain-containing protein n=1 Tax=Myripristis murdjan TaxID=586833 RepID=A0A667ZIQ7_9TELE